MAQSRSELVSWALEKATEYLESAKDNLKLKRLFPGAEDVFRSVETTFESLLYLYGVRKIEYPGGMKKFTGRLALQFLIRDTLLATGRIDKEAYERYLKIATDLHGGGYSPGKKFDRDEIEENLRFAKGLLAHAKTQVSKLL